MQSPKLIILLSGKRKCGKDYLGEILLKEIGESNAEIIRISKPIKSHWSKLKSLDLNELLSDGPYKEQYRRDMIEWSDQIRRENPGFFCAEAYSTITNPIAIVCDVRRKTDIEYFKGLNIPLLTVRISTPNDVRMQRGWKYECGIDDVASECDLDNYNQWNYEFINDGTTNLNITKLMENINNYLLN